MHWLYVHVSMSSEQMKLLLVMVSDQVHQGSYTKTIKTFSLCKITCENIQYTSFLPFVYMIVPEGVNSRLFVHPK